LMGLSYIKYFDFITIPIPNIFLCFGDQESADKKIINEHFSKISLTTLYFF
jgi:hypothetical protein